MITAIILTKNEEANIVDCIESVLWCDEIVVIDDYSEDRTIEVIKSVDNKKIKVFQKRLNKDFSAQRNFGLSKAINRWVLYVDADERVSADLRKEILSKTKSTNFSNGYYIKREDFMWGKLLKHGEVGSIKLLRLAKKDSGIWHGPIHEIWRVDGRIGRLKYPLFHYPHSTIDKFLKEINFYTDLRATELFKKGIKPNWLLIILYPKAKFYLNYFLKLGFLDGLGGLVFAILMSLHSFLVRAKLWLLWQKD
jgi:glycosyltransferase involved in cell wall biosynthesis